MDNGDITNLSFLLLEIKFVNVFKPRNMVITHTSMFVGKKWKPFNTPVWSRKTRPINKRMMAFMKLTMRNFLGKTL